MSAAPFEAMARRIEKIDSAEFAGAVVIVPPGGEDAPIEFVMSNPAPDMLLFWTSLESLVKIRAAEAMQNEDARRMQSRSFGR